MKWLEPWHPIEDPDEAKNFVVQMRKEIPPDHALSGKRLRAVGRRDDEDGVLFAVVDETTIAEVYLNWVTDPIGIPDLPFTRLYPDERTWEETGLSGAKAQGSE